MADPRINTAPPDFDSKAELPEGFLDFLLPLHREFTPRQQSLARRRRDALAASHAGRLPTHLPRSEATTDWRIELPEWYWISAIR